MKGGQTPDSIPFLLAYCLSNTSTSLTFWPSALVPLAVIVMTFPSLEATSRDVRTTFPAFLKVDLVVLALTRLSAMVSAPPGPVCGELVILAGDVLQRTGLRNCGRALNSGAAWGYCSG